MRPLLDVTSAEVAAYVTARELQVVRDPTNANLAYRRSRLRHEVLPLLRRERADLDRALVALCDRLAQDADALDAQADRFHHALADAGGLDARALGDLPDAIAARVVARAAGISLDSVHIDAIRRLCAGLHGTRSLDLPGGLVAERRYDRLRFGVRLADPGDVEVPITGPGLYSFLRVTVEIAPDEWATLATAGRLVLRNFRQGDVVRSGKLKALLIDRKVPRPERRWLPLLVRLPNEVLWAPGLIGKELKMSALT